jgi:cytochrome c-type biogenesis protein CcmH
MSRRDTFWFLAGALVTVAILVTARAWLRAPIPAPQLAGAQVASPAPSQQTRQSAANAGSLDDVTQKLAARLATTGGSDNDWRLLAQSYEYMGRTAEAQAAAAHRILPSTALPGDGGTTAGNDLATDGELAQIADALEKPPAGSAEHPGTGWSQNDVPASGATSASESVHISGTVELASKLAAQAQSGATLFIYARQPGTPGPPLAVLRLRADHWPVTFTLSDENAMVPGRSLSNANNVQVEARISRDGDALPRPGDLVGTVTSVNPRAGHIVKISIDRPIG